MATNPVTFRPAAHGVNLTLGRLWIGSGKAAPWQKIISVLMWRGDDAAPEVLAQTQLDEEHFLRGLRELFPHGELSLHSVHADQVGRK
jgi:hypothetical protein